MDPEHYALLVRLEAKLAAHIDDEDATLARIERCLDGNGQPGLVRALSVHAERLTLIEEWRRTIEAWRLEVVRFRQWQIGLVVTTALAIAGMVITHVWGV